MKKPQVNYAFIDGNNLHLGIADSGWRLDYKRFRTYLREHYGVIKAYYFVGYIPEYEPLYQFLESAGYTMKYKEISLVNNRDIKGNVDSEIVLQAMLDINQFEKAVLVSSDGDFACLVEHLYKNAKLECVLAPMKDRCSHLLKKAARERIDYIEQLKTRIEYKK